MTLRDNLIKPMDRRARLLFAGIVILYSLLIIYGIYNHEQWEDEAQSWQMVRNLGLLDLLRALPFEGHPPLWYLILFPFVKAGAPYIIQNCIAGLVMILTVYILLFKTTLPTYLKIASVFSFYFLYEYAIIARSYCLVALLLVLIVAVYKDRFNRPYLFALLVVALFNTHMLAFTFAAAVGGMFAYDAYQKKRLNRKILGAFTLMIIGGAYLIPYIVLPNRSVPTQRVFNEPLGQIVKALTWSSFTFTTHGRAAIVWVLAIVFCLIGRPKAFITLLCGLAGILYVMVFYLGRDIQHYGIIFLFILASYGLAFCYENEVEVSARLGKGLLSTGCILFAISLCYQIFLGFRFYNDDRRMVYSDAKGAAEFLIKNNLDSKILVGYKSIRTVALLPFLNKNVQFYFPDCGQWGKYMQWDKFIYPKWGHFSSDEIAIRADSLLSSKASGAILILSANEIMGDAAKGMWRLIYASPPSVITKEERYFIYRDE